MKTRYTLVAAAAAALLVSPPAALAESSRAVKQVCNLIKDAPGDAGTRAGGDPLLPSPPMDILSADIATGAKTIMATIKVSSFETDPQTVFGVTYYFYFTAKGKTATDYNFSLFRGFQGDTEFSFSGGAASGSVNPSTNTITFTTSRSNVKALSARGVKLIDLRATTKTRMSNADSANAGKVVYADRTPSCLKPA